MDSFNPVFGRNGRFFPLYVVLVGLMLAAGAVLAWSGVFVGYEDIGFIVVCIASVLCLYAGFAGLQSIRVIRRTVKSIRVEDDMIHCRTFDNKVLVTRRTAVSKLGRRRFPKPVDKLLFPRRMRHYSLFSGKYFVSGKMPDLDEILPFGILNPMSQQSLSVDSDTALT